jgi:hypothetical protein
MDTQDATAADGSSSDDATKNAERLAALKAAAESQMRRPAPAIGSSSSNKRQRASNDGDDGDADDEEEKEEAAAAARVSRYDYAAADALLAPGGARGLIITCRLRRQMSATREAFNLLAPRLPQGARCSVVKVGSPGLAVMVVRGGGGGDGGEGHAAAAASDAETAAAIAAGEPPQAEADVVALAAGVLADVERGALPRARFVERAIPFEATCALSDAAAIRAAADAVCKACVARRIGGESGGAPLEFAVAYKSREFEGCSSGGAGGGSEQQPPATAGGDAATTTTAAAPQQQLQRGEVIAILAAAMNSATSSAGREAKVNLSKPSITVIAEVLPVLVQGKWTPVLGLAAVDTQALVAVGKGRGLQVRTLTSQQQQQQQQGKQQQGKQQRRPKQ